MDILQALYLGILQGFTEFLPISSSAHLVLAQHCLGLREPQLFFDVAVHVGTLMAVLVLFRSDLALMAKGCLKSLHRSNPQQYRADATNVNIGVALTLMILLGSVPTFLIGFFLRDVFNRLFASPFTVGIGLWITGLFLIWSRWANSHRKHLDSPSWLDALMIGLTQGGAITPGVSRSGVTITVGLLLGLKPELAFRFSFLLSIPAILGALAFEVFHADGNHPKWDVVAVGFVSAFLVGWAALRLLQSLVSRGKFFYFSPYCFVLGAIAFLIAYS
jgi:undecaprenyl-diphosphatase